MTPRVSVVMALRDGEAFLREALESVLGQTLSDLELIVVDDGSADRTPSILDGFDDPRVVRLRNAKSVGQAEARNKRLAAARAEWVAMMDADDVCLPTRLERQVEFLAQHPEVGAAGTLVEVIDEEGRHVDGGFEVPASAAMVAWRLLLFANPLVHSSVMTRRSLVAEAGGYDGSFVPAEDRDLWSRLFQRTQLANVPETLLRYRLHSSSQTALHRERQRGYSLQIRRSLLAEVLGGDDPGQPITAWYEPRLSQEQVEGLTDLFLVVFTHLASGGRFARAEIDEVREDLSAPLASLRRRDGRVPRESLARAYWSSLFPESLKARVRRARR